MIVAARDYGGLAIDPNTGDAVRRSAAIEPILHELAGAESALVVGTSAGALQLALTALSAGKETVVARGQMLESDDGCRMSDIVAQSGAFLREVGSVNVVRAEDYAAAIGEKTGALLVADASSLLLQGRVELAGLAEVADVGRKQRIPSIHMLDTGSLVDLTSLGLPARPTVKDSIGTGTDVVIFSGDKLVGGPSCGILLGRRATIEKIQKHPLARAMQTDKITLAALSATLQLYRDEEKAKQEIPLLRLLGTSVENLKNRAERLAPQMAAAKKAIASAEAVEEVSHYLGSAIPSQAIPTWCIALTPNEMTVERLAAALRAGTPSVVGRVTGDRYLLDLRSVFPRQDIDLVTAVEALG
jgi:L-seryl-tRNA(Ser) seleniumtransferase